MTVSGSSSSARAALEMLKRLNWQPDVLHCNDGTPVFSQTG